MKLKKKKKNYLFVTVVRHLPESVATVHSVQVVELPPQLIGEITTARAFGESEVVKILQRKLKKSIAEFKSQFVEFKRATWTIVYRLDRVGQSSIIGRHTITNVSPRKEMGFIKNGQLAENITWEDYPLVIDTSAVYRLELTLPVIENKAPKD